MSAKKKQADTPDFEKSIAQLESLVDKLEHNDTGLEQSLEAFEAGIKLTREAQKALLDAEQKVQVLLEQNGEVKIADSLKGEDDE